MRVLPLISGDGISATASAKQDVRGGAVEYQWE